MAVTVEEMTSAPARGNVVTPVDRDQVKGIVRDLVDSGVESLTIGLIEWVQNRSYGLPDLLLLVAAHGNRLVELGQVQHDAHPLGDDQLVTDAARPEGRGPCRRARRR